MCLGFGAGAHVVLRPSGEAHAPARHRMTAISQPVINLMIILQSININSCECSAHSIFIRVDSALLGWCEPWASSLYAGKLQQERLALRAMNGWTRTAGSRGQLEGRLLPLRQRCRRKESPGSTAPAGSPAGQHLALQLPSRGRGARGGAPSSDGHSQPRLPRTIAPAIDRSGTSW